MTTLTWLHLSDLHACHPRHGWDAGRVTETLVEDLRRLQAAHDLRPDLIFFTGDAAFGHIGSAAAKTVAGQLEEFARFLAAVRAAFEPEVALENVFLVPGNHDVDRRWATPDQTEWLDRQGSIDPVRSMIQAGGVQCRRYMERLADYRAFLEGHGGLGHLLADPERLIYSTVREVGDVRVGVAGFNSAWSCCRNGERGRLWMAGKWQQGMLRPDLRGADVSIALVHHPPDWLAEHETPDFGRGLAQDFQFLLHGHEHRAWVLGAGEYHVIAAGACYERSDSGRNGYNLVRLFPDEGRGEVWLRRYDSDGGGWVKHVVAKHAEDGVWPLALDWLAAARGRRQAGSETGSETAPGIGAAAPSEAEVVGDATPGEPGMPGDSVAPAVAELSDIERYLQRLRAAHRDLPLAGFETNVRLPIRIDDVYIPLRARAMHAVSERQHRQFGAWRELDGLGMPTETERDVAFDEAVELAREHGLRGVVVLGDPGSGKTTLLKHYVLAATDPLIGPAALGLPEDTLPVLIELRHLDDPAAGLKRAVEAAVGQVDIALEAAAFTRRLLRRDRLLVLVDGLDEVADQGQRVKVSRWLEDAIRQLPASTFVVSSRYAGYKADARLDGRFLELHVRSVEEGAAKRFIAAWYGAVESQAELGRDDETAAAVAGEAAADLGAKIFTPQDERIKSLRELARNPLMLQILCLVHRDRKRLPERRVELYRECVLVLLELWRRAKGLLLSFDAQQALRLLQPLAWRLHREERREADLRELLPYLETPLRELRRDAGDGAELLAAIRDQSGVLVSLGQTAYGFLHLSFQEYLAALHVQDRHASEPAVLRELASHFGEPWWREVILLSLGLNNPSLFEPLMATILELGVLHRDVALADDCLRDALATSPRPFLAALAAGIEGDEERYHALRLLKRVAGWESAGSDGASGRQIVEGLARAEEYPPTRSQAVELLGGEPAQIQEPESFAIVVPRERERVHEKDGSVLVYVPGGEFTLGTDEDLKAYSKEFRHLPKPQHRVVLSHFWIGKYPVTNAQYRRFLADSSSQAKPEYWDDEQFNEPEQPVVGVSWLDALSYCSWAGLALPSEAQWEAAARGTEARAYPWGDAEPTRELANYGTNEVRPTPVGAYPEGAGPYGTLDQAGNVWEWCRDIFDENAYRGRDGERDPCILGKEEGDTEALRVVRGGSFGSPSGGLRAARRFRSPAGAWGRGVGFRVCRSVPEHGD